MRGNIMKALNTLKEKVIERVIGLKEMHRDKGSEGLEIIREIRSEIVEERALLENLIEIGPQREQ